MTPVEQHIYDKIESWVQEQSWDCEETVSTVMAETNCIFDWSTYDDIHISEIDNSTFTFSVRVTLEGEARKEDVAFAGDTIHLDVSGTVEFDSQSGEWEISDEYEVGAELEDWRDEEDFIFPDDEDSKPLTADKIISILSNLKRGLWYRGQSNFLWPLQTSIARVEGVSLSTEEALRREFDRRIAFLDTVKHPLPLPELYFLMQHHGVPTRLLDWTTNPLVALYFALSDEKEKENPACIWVLDPSQLNRMFNENYPAKLDEKLLTGKDDSKVIAICAAHTNSRMNSQRAEFTVHMHYTPLDRMKEATVAIKEKIIIPAHLKAELKEKLRTLGVDRSTLFPDLDNIAKTVVEDVLEEK